MTEREELELLRNTVSLMTGKAQAGLCQMSVGGKHEFLRDIVKLGDKAGYDIFGLPKDETAPMPAWYTSE